MEMNHTTKKRRIQAVKLADALNAIEGVPVSDYAQKLSQQWVDGELSGEEMKAFLLEYHRKIASEKRALLENDSRGW